MCGGVVLFAAWTHGLGGFLGVLRDYGQLGWRSRGETGEILGIYTGFLFPGRAFNDTGVEYLQWTVLLAGVGYV